MENEKFLNEHLEYFEGNYIVNSQVNGAAIALGNSIESVIRSELDLHYTGVSKAINEVFLAGNNDKLERILKRLELALKSKSNIKEVPINQIKPIIISTYVPGAKKTMIKMLIDQIEKLIIPNQPAPEPKLKWSTTFGDEVKLVRLVNVLHEMNLLYSSDGMRVTKKEAMQAFGSFFGLDLTNYSQKLTSDTTISEEKYFQFFDEMKSKANGLRNKKMGNQTKH